MCYPSALPPGTQKIRTDSYGSVVILPDDRFETYLMPGQKFIPHALPYNGKFEVGQCVLAHDWIQERWNIPCIVIISRTRLWRNSKQGNYHSYYRQVELMGQPCLWFSDTHFSPIN